MSYVPTVRKVATLLLASMYLMQKHIWSHGGLIYRLYLKVNA